MDPLGLYLSIPFCRAKCSFCNFASDAFAPGRLPGYVDRLCEEIASARRSASGLGWKLPDTADTVYFGGGTPSLLSPGDVRRIFSSLRDQFLLPFDPEITVECAPNQLSPATLEELQRHGVNRLSFGVQSFIDRESAAIGRLHSAQQCRSQFEQVRSAGILNLSLDLIAGLPHQTEASWISSIDQAVASGVPHISVYMLEVDEDSRLGREILAGGDRYGGSTVPSDDDSAAFYQLACDRLASAGIAQYEISNFARPGFQSAHNLKYWRRKPYLGFGLDAHSFLRSASGAVRFANTGDLEAYLHPAPRPGGEGSAFHLLALASHRAALASQRTVVEPITENEAFEETLFLGLRTNGGLRVEALRDEFGNGLVDLVLPLIIEAAAEGLVALEDDRIHLTARGRVLSNELFSRLLIPAAA